MVMASKMMSLSTNLCKQLDEEAADVDGDGVQDDELEHEPV